MTLKLVVELCVQWQSVFGHVLTFIALAKINEIFQDQQKHVNVCTMSQNLINKHTIDI